MESLLSCMSPVRPLPPMLTCTNQNERVPYTLVCDHRPDCSDHSDERFCVFPHCSDLMFDCANQQCIPRHQKCDQIAQCINAEDEQECDHGNEGYSIFVSLNPSPPSIVNFDGHGDFIVSTPNETRHNLSTCPDTHYLCPERSFYCLPVYTRCNDVYDCPGREDEMMCDIYRCPGMYRCRASHTCVHITHLCDNIFDCPQYDDELYCHLPCPHNCTCHAHAFFCSGWASLNLYPELRFLEAKGSGLTPADLADNTLLIHLNLESCGLRHLQLPVLNNLRILKLGDNQLTSLDTKQLSQLKHLSTLSLSGNPLVFQDLFSDQIIPSLLVLDISRSEQQWFDVTSLAAFPNLQTVNLSQSGVDRVMGEGFKPLRNLQVLDMKGCPVTQFPHDLFDGLEELWQVNVDNYKLCCQQILPKDFNLKNCFSPVNEVSSCETLLQSTAYRVLLAVLGTVALLCNLASFVYRVLSHTSSSSGFNVFVSHLSVSDFLMGVYLAIVGVADRLYEGSYLWKDTEWRHSAACHLAGFLSLLSCEVSALIICLITLDRFLALRFPFSHLHFHRTSAHIACAIVWSLGFLLAVTPLLPVTSHWKYYSQTGICIPLPITKNEFAGQKYSFVIMIVLNFILFLLIAIGQMTIYWSIQSNSLSSSDASRKSKDQTIARRLITIALSDFLCWFPIGLLGLLASKGVAIPGEVNVSMAIIVMPLNSSLNPFLYTINIILERRRQVREEQLQKHLLAQLQSQAVTSSTMTSAVDKLKTSCTTEHARVLLKKWVEKKILTMEELHNLITNKP